MKRTFYVLRGELLLDPDDRGEFYDSGAMGDLITTSLIWVILVYSLGGMI